ncbi:uncharacterized protein [Nicotiana sylvestris]|uniref:uncharacterized protein n=1 Tax=Nicotiana sylvestris TaxID=4096 RepID=UPI00388CE94A
MFPDVRLPLGFKIPKFEKYDGHGNPMAHLKKYCNQQRSVGGKEELLMAYFGESLTGVASEWFMDQNTSHWYVWDDMARAFVKQFQYNIDIAPDHNSLSNPKQKPTKSFREYAIKWREQAARVKPPMDDHELITVFFKVQEPDYFQNMMSVVGKSFSKAIKMGEIVENGLKTGRIISQAVLKAATQAFQIDSDNFGNTNEKFEEIMMTSGSRRGPRRTSRRYEQPSQPPKHPRRRAQASQNLLQPPQNFQVPYKPHPSQGYRAEQRLKANFIPIGDSSASLFEKLKHYDMIAPIPPNHVDPHARSFDPSKRFEYHSNAQGHDIESCQDLKREIERMIQKKLIVIQDSNTQNITQNPLPVHYDAHFMGMIPSDMEYENPLGNLPTEIREDHGDSDEHICG